MVKQEIIQRKMQEQPTQLFIGETTRPFAKMESASRCGNIEFSDLNLKFGKIDFSLSAHQNFGLDVHNEQYGEDMFYELVLKGRIYSIDELKWLQRFQIRLTTPTDNSKSKSKFLGLFAFTETFPIDGPEEEIQENGYVDLQFVSNVYDFNLQSTHAREKIEMIVVDTTIPSQQLPFPMPLNR